MNLAGKPAAAPCRAVNRDMISIAERGIRDFGWLLFPRIGDLQVRLWGSQSDARA